MSHHTLTKLTNGSYVLAHNNNFVLAYHKEADEYVTWRILDNDINKTHDGCYYSKINDAIDCYLDRTGKKHYRNKSEFVTSMFSTILNQYIHTEYENKALYKDNAGISGN